MPQIANIVLTDDTATSHTFTPRSVDKQVGMYWDMSGGIPSVADLLNLRGWDIPTGYKVASKLQQAISGTDANGTTVKVGENIFSFEFKLAENSTAAERSALHAMAISLIQAATVEAHVVQGERLYG